MVEKENPKLKFVAPLRPIPVGFNVEAQNPNFSAIDWNAIEPTEHIGAWGVAYWRTHHLGPLRIRLIEYLPGFVADQWSRVGMLLFCLDGSLHTELKNGHQCEVAAGMSLFIPDRTEDYLTYTLEGAKVYIVD